jgi:23S rRNA pseudouridine1911/1915/1917 synthase
LDKETSGVLLLAKNLKAYEFLKNQFKSREVKKIYNAIVSGWVKDDHGMINKLIGRSPSDFRRHLAGRGARGELREAITEYRVLKRFKVLAPFSYLEIKPKTGRTHQIRVHMKFLNHPVVCDSLYDPKGFCPKEIKRLALHAKSIEFKNLKEKIIKVDSSLPKEFLKITKN